MKYRLPGPLAGAILLAVTTVAAEEAPDSPSTPTEAVLAGVDLPDLRALASEVLRQNPTVAAVEATNRALRQRTGQSRALPDPIVELTAFPAPPETRVGPQLFKASYWQDLPWAGKRGLREEAAESEATAGERQLEAHRLELLTKTRTLFYELAFTRRARQIHRMHRLHLLQHEEISRARYSTGAGSMRGVLKLQAEITRVDREELTLATREVQLVAEINALRDQPADTPIATPGLAAVERSELSVDSLLAVASSTRPELAAADAEARRAVTLGELASKQAKPDFTIGLSYTWVDERQDAAGRMNPPEGNGDDVLGLMGSLTLPVWKSSREASIAEAVQLETGAREMRRLRLAEMAAEIGELTRSLPMVWRQVRLLEDVLLVQASQALESAKAGYAAGTEGALGLLEAEHVLFEAQISLARVTADYLIGIARLEGEVGAPLGSVTRTSEDPS